MLYDTRWEIKAKPGSLESLIAWLERQNPNIAYDYTRTDSCLIARYAKAHGIKGWDFLSERELGNMGFHYIACGHAGEGKSAMREGIWSYGAALARAREVLARRDRERGKIK